MSREVKDLIIEEYRSRFEGVNDALLIDLRALNANDNNTFRSTLRDKQIKVTVVRNELVKKAVDGTGLRGLDPILTGPSAIVYGGDSVVEVARLVLDQLKAFKTLELKGAVLDGQLFAGKDGVDALSKFPTRDEAQAQVVQVILGPASSLLGAITGPGGTIGGILKSLEEKLEKGETVAKVGA